MSYRLSTAVLSTDTDDGMVLLCEHTGRYWQLNATAASILRALLRGSSVDHVAHGLVQRHRISPARARSDVQALAERMRAAGLITS